MLSSWRPLDGHCHLVDVRDVRSDLQDHHVLFGVEDTGGGATVDLSADNPARVGLANPLAQCEPSERCEVPIELTLIAEDPNSAESSSVRVSVRLELEAVLTFVGELPPPNAEMAFAER